MPPPSFALQPGGGTALLSSLEGFLAQGQPERWQGVPMVEVELGEHGIVFRMMSRHIRLLSVSATASPSSFN